MRRRTFLKRGLTSVALTAGGTALYAGGFERHHVETTETKIHLGLTTPIRVVAVGDLHFDPLYEDWFLADVMARIRTARPDVLFLTGDYVTKSNARCDELAAILATSAPRFGAYAVLGNHEYWSGKGPIIRAFQAQGIQVLQNAAAPLPGNPRWFIAGLESYWGGRPDPAFLSRVPPDAQFIALIHEPDPFRVLDHPRIRLQVSGHTHGGQIRVPLVGALQLPSWGRHYDAGLFTAGGRHLYVHRGIGTIRFHYRLNCRPEITCVDLT